MCKVQAPVPPVGLHQSENAACNQVSAKDEEYDDSLMACTCQQISQPPLRAPCRDLVIADKEEEAKVFGKHHQRSESAKKVQKYSRTRVHETRGLSRCICHCCVIGCVGRRDDR